MRIFLVEDDPDELSMYEYCLKDRHRDVELSRIDDPNQFIEFLETLSTDNLPDAIILDLRMPKMNGYDLLVQIRSSKRYESIPIFICSNTSDDEDQLRCLRAGASDYIVKPWKISSYTVIVDKIVEQVNGGAAINNV